MQHCKQFVQTLTGLQADSFFLQSDSMTRAKVMTLYAVHLRFNSLRTLKKSDKKKGIMFSSSVVTKSPIKVVSIKGYLKAASDYCQFTLGIGNPTSVQGKELPLLTRLLKRMKFEEKGKRLKKPFLFVHLASSLHLASSPETGCLFWWSMLSLFTGFRASEFLLTPHNVNSNLDRYNLPCQLVRSDFSFKVRVDQFGSRLKTAAPGTPRSSIVAVAITFRNQKNGDNDCERVFWRNDQTEASKFHVNGWAASFAGGDDWLKCFCPVIASLMLVDHFDSVYSNKTEVERQSLHFAVGSKGERLTSSQLCKFMRTCVRLESPDIDDSEVALYTPHSLRVGALYQYLDKGSSVNIVAIQFMLRWKSNAYLEYVRETVSSQSLTSISVSQSNRIASAMQKQLAGNSSSLESDPFIAHLANSDSSFSNSVLVQDEEDDEEYDADYPLQ